MEEAINKIVNLGIGTTKTVNTEAQDLYSKLQAQVNQWIAEGEAATDENSLRIKSTLEKSLAGVKDIEGKVQSFIEEISAQVEALKPAEQPKEAATA